MYLDDSHGNGISHLWEGRTGDRGAGVTHEMLTWHREKSYLKKPMVLRKEAKYGFCFYPFNTEMHFIYIR